MGQHEQGEHQRRRQPPAARINGHEYSWLKVRSSLIRLVKSAYQKHNISMPDEAREVIFPRGVPVTMVDNKPGDIHDARSPKQPSTKTPNEELDAVSTKAEAGLSSEAGVIKEQAREAQPLQEGQNLLPNASSHPSPEQEA